jgi:hypothetical protein
MKIQTISQKYKKFIRKDSTLSFHSLHFYKIISEIMKKTQKSISYSFPGTTDNQYYFG